MPHMALVATAGANSIITDSANSASAYATGHKSAVNAMGVYADRTAIRSTIRKVETISSLVKRRLGLAVGVVTNTEVEDATPAAMIAHTRRRVEYDNIVEQFFAFKPDVLMGGGLHAFPAARAPPAASATTTRTSSSSSATPATPTRRPRRSWPARPRRRHRQAARPVQLRQHGRRARPQIPQGRHRKEISGPARSHRSGRRRAATAVAQAGRLLPDGRIRHDRQIHPPARHGARGVRHDHARQRRQARAKEWARRATTR